MIYFSNFVHCLLICVPVTRWCASVLCPRQLLLLLLQQQPINLNYQIYNEPSIEFRLCVCPFHANSSVHPNKPKFEFCPSNEIYQTHDPQKPNKNQTNVCFVASFGTLLYRGKSLWIWKLYSQLGSATPQIMTRNPLLSIIW